MITDKNSLCQQYLHIVYHDVPVHGTYADQNIAKTYGEILYPGIDKLLSAITLTDDDVFVDLGSGLGKPVMQVFLKSTVREAYGIEIVPELHQQALLAAQRVENDLPDFYAGGRKCRFLLGDFLELPLTTATVVLICSQCYSQDMLLALSKIINHSTNIHTVLTLRPLPTLRRLPFKEAIRIECSWDTALCYVYRK